MIKKEIRSLIGFIEKKHLFLKTLLLSLCVMIPLYIYNMQRAYRTSFMFTVVYPSYPASIEAAKNSPALHKDFHERRRDSLAAMITGYENHDWDMMNAAYFDYLNQEQEVSLYTTYEAKLNLAEAEFLLGKGIEHELSDEYPITGINFMMQCSRLLFPFIFLLFSCYFLSVLFSYKDSDDNKYLKLVFGLSVLVSGGIFIHLLPYLIGSVCHGPSSLLYPYLFHDGYKAFFLPLTHLMLPGICLLLLLSCSIYGLMRIISIIMKKQITSFFFGVIFCFGAFLLCNNSSSYTSISHLIPFTYIHISDIISGSLAVQYKNFHLTFLSGVINLSFFILSEFLVLTLLHKMQAKKSVIFVKQAIQ